MENFTVQIEGLKGMEQALAEMPDRLAKGSMRAAVRAGASVILNDIKARTPRGIGRFEFGTFSHRTNRIKSTRHLRNAFRVSTRFEGLTASASISAGKAAFLLNWLERTGTKPHREPKRGKGHLRLGGGRIFSSVMHPGFRPKPFVVPAFEESWRRAVEAFSAKLRVAIERIKARA